MVLNKVIPSVWNNIFVRSDAAFRILWILTARYSHFHISTWLYGDDIPVLEYNIVGHQPSFFWWNQPRLKSENWCRVLSYQVMISHAILTLFISLSPTSLGVSLCAFPNMYVIPSFNVHASQRFMHQSIHMWHFSRNSISDRIDAEGQRYGMR